MKTSRGVLATTDWNPWTQAISPAENGLKKVAEGRQQELTDEEMNGLEAIVLPQNRPVVFVRGDFYDDVEHPWEKLNPI